jgi:predicted transcriptional regulator
MANHGQLERGVMDALWEEESPRTAYDVADRIAEVSGKAPAPTTVLTVLSRLERKGFVAVDRTARPHRYRALATRADHMAELMHEVLGGAGDRTAVLERFVGGVSPEDTETLRRLLDRATGA